MFYTLSHVAVIPIETHHSTLSIYRFQWIDPASDPVGSKKFLKQLNAKVYVQMYIDLEEKFSGRFIINYYYIYMHIFKKY